MLHELFVFGALGGDAWTRILEARFRYLADSVDAGMMGTLREPLQPVMRQLTLEKTMDRLGRFESDTEIDLYQEWRYAGSYPFLFVVSPK